MLLGLELARELGATQVDVVNDSELVSRQIEGRYKVKNAGLKPLYLETLESLRGFEDWSVTSVRRESNERADQLVNEELDREGRGDERPVRHPVHRPEASSRATWTPWPTCCARARWAWGRCPRVRGGLRRAARRPPRRGRGQLHGSAAPGLPGRRGGAGRRGHRALVHLRGHRVGGALLRRHARVRRHRGPGGPRRRSRGRGGQDHRSHQGRGVRALRRLPGGRRPAGAAVRRPRAGADRGLGPRAQRHARRAQAGHDRPGRRVLVLLQQDPGRGRGGLLATDDDDVAALARSRRSHALRRLRRRDALGYNYRWDEPRAALALSRLAAGWRRTSRPRRGWCASTARAWAASTG